MSDRILVANNTSANIQALAATLKEQGHQISVATNGWLRAWLLLDRQPA